MSNLDIALQQFVPAARNLEAATGIPVAYSLAQATNETDLSWALTQKPIPFLFGIKGVGPSGLSVQAKTWEVVNGQRVNTTAQFAAYNSIDEAFQHLGRQDVIRNAPKDSAASYFGYLQSKGWATDPSYASTLTARANQIQTILNGGDAGSGGASDAGGNPSGGAAGAAGGGGMADTAVGTATGGSGGATVTTAGASGVQLNPLADWWASAERGIAEFFTRSVLLTLGVVLIALAALSFTKIDAAKAAGKVIE